MGRAGIRSHYDSFYGKGGEAAELRAPEASRRALTLGPDLVDAATRPIVYQVEHGDLEGALGAADELVEGRPDSAFAHFARSYARRYAGFLDEAIADCEHALDLEPTNHRVPG